MNESTFAALLIPKALLPNMHVRARNTGYLVALSKQPQVTTWLSICSYHTQIKHWNQPGHAQIRFRNQSWQHKLSVTIIFDIV